MLRWLACVLASAVLLAASAGAEGPRGALKIDGYVSQGAFDGKLLWFKLSWFDQLFLAHPQNTPNAEALWDAVYTANKESRTLTVWFDPETASIDHKLMRPTFIVRMVEYNRRNIAGDLMSEARDPKTISTPQDKAETALAKGIAYHSAGQSAKAGPLLNQALAFELDTPLKILALRARASLLEDEAISRLQPGEARDRGLMASLQDARAWRQAAPDNINAALSEARLLAMLGGFDEALAAYDGIAKQWPKENWQLYRALAALHRRMGHFQESLDWMEKVAQVQNMRASMPYRFNRGWTLDEMGRYEEAIADYSEGLKAQPDFEGAFWRRSCDYAAVGQLELALYDMRTARALHEHLLAEVALTPASSFDRARYGEAEDVLAAAVATDPHRKMTGLCKGFWDWGDGPRSRSKLLPAPKQGGAGS